MGSQAVEVIQQLGFASNASEAEAFGGKLIAAKIVKHVDEQEETIKDDIFFYQFIMDLSAAPDIDTSNEQQVQCSTLIHQIPNVTNITNISDQTPFKINRRPRDDSDPKVRSPKYVLFPEFVYVSSIFDIIYLPIIRTVVTGPDRSLCTL